MVVAVLASRSRRSLARVETPLSGENRGETAVFAGYSLNPTMVLPLNETPLEEVKSPAITTLKKKNVSENSVQAFLLLIY